MDLFLVLKKSVRGQLKVIEKVKNSDSEYVKGVVCGT